MDEMTCNGWKNYTTWLLNLWYGDVLQDVCNDWLDDNEEEDNIYDLADYLKEYIDDLLSEMYPKIMTNGSFLLDIINGSLREIDYTELATSYRKNWQYEQDYEEDKND